MTILDRVLPYLPATLIAVLTLRSTITGASIGDAISIISLAGLYGYKLYLDSKIKLDPSAELAKEIEKLKGEISNVSIAISQRPKSAPVQFKF